MAARAMLVLLIAVYGATITLADQCDNATALSARLDALLAQYPRDQLPGPLNVSVALHVRRATVDETTSRVHLTADLSLNWTDSRLWWNASEWDCGATLVDADLLWRPDIELVSSGTSNGGTSGRILRARLAAGAVRWVQRLDVYVPLPLTLARWPKDTQSPVFKFASRQYNKEELDLAIVNIMYANTFDSGAWKTISISNGILSEIQDLEGNKRRVAAWTLTLQRHAAAEGAAAAAALMAAGLMLVAAGLQPPANRMVLAAGASLTAAIWLASISPLLSQASSPPCVATAACACCVLGALQAACGALLARVAHCGRKPPLEESSSGCGTWRALATLLDRVLLAVSVLILSVLYFRCL